MERKNLACNRASDYMSSCEATTKVFRDRTFVGNSVHTSAVAYIYTPAIELSG
jgi:hypothetical protein